MGWIRCRRCQCPIHPRLRQDLIGLHSIKRILALLTRTQDLFRRRGGCQLRGRLFKLLMEVIDFRPQQLQLLARIIILPKRDYGQHGFFWIDLRRKIRMQDDLIAV